MPALRRGAERQGRGGQQSDLGEDADKTWWERETGRPAKAKAAPKAMSPELGSGLSHSAEIAAIFNDQSASALFEAVNRAVLATGYRVAESDPEQHRIVFKTSMSMSKSRVKLDIQATDGKITIKRAPIPLLAWGEKNRVTREVLGALEGQVGRPSELGPP